MIANRISKVSCTKDLISRGMSSFLILVGVRTKAITPISSMACFLRVLSFSYSLKRVMASTKSLG